jgi:hypothetical protein
VWSRWAAIKRNEVRGDKRGSREGISREEIKEKEKRKVIRPKGQGKKKEGNQYKPNRKKKEEKSSEFHEEALGFIGTQLKKKKKRKRSKWGTGVIISYLSLWSSSTSWSTIFYCYFLLF